MKYCHVSCATSAVNGRTPHGVRGLKLYRMFAMLLLVIGSHPSRGAWIEIRSMFIFRLRPEWVAPLTGCVD